MISGIGSSAQLSSKLFSALDTKSQGFLEKSDFVSAFSKLSSTSTSSSSTSVDDVFSALDSNSDGKVTKDEFATTLAKLQEQLDSSRMHGGGHGGPHGAGGPPPPPPADDAGFTKDELSSQLEESSSSDSKRTELLSKIVSNFEAADTNSDGKVSFTEAMAYDQSSQNSSASDAASGSRSSSNSEAGIMMKIMQLMQAYGGNSQEQSSSGVASQLSVSA